MKLSAEGWLPVIGEAPVKAHAYEDRDAKCVGTKIGDYSSQKFPARFYLYDDGIVIVTMLFTKEDA